jgi:hypothetical protein
VTSTLQVAEEMVASLIAETNRAHPETWWDYELTSEVANIGVASSFGTHTLRIHPCWLRYVVGAGDFTSCVADEVQAWYLLTQLTGKVTVAA